MDRTILISMCVFLLAINGFICFSNAKVIAEAHPPPPSSKYKPASSPPAPPSKQPTPAGSTLPATSPPLSGHEHLHSAASASHRDNTDKIIFDAHHHVPRDPSRDTLWQRSYHAAWNTRVGPAVCSAACWVAAFYFLYAAYQNGYDTAPIDEKSVTSRLRRKKAE